MDRGGEKRKRASEMGIDTDVPVGGQWKLGKHLGHGAYGTVFRARHLETGQVAAVKASRTGDAHLHREHRMYRALNGACDSVGIATVFDFIRDGAHDFLVLELLGVSLDKLVDMCGGAFTVDTVLMIGVQMIARLAFVHRFGCIHGDVKPSNMIVGHGSAACRVVHVVDFGSCTHFKCMKSGRHVEYSEHNRNVGTLLYASVHNHGGVAGTRRDDMIALGYSLLHLATGSLPWLSICRADARREEKTKRMKEQVDLETLCARLPKEFKSYLQYVLALAFDQRPDYSYLKRLFRRALHQRHSCEQDPFDWQNHPHFRARTPMNIHAC